MELLVVPMPGFPQKGSVKQFDERNFLFKYYV